MRLLLGFLLFSIWASFGTVYYVCQAKCHEVNHCGYCDKSELNDSLNFEDTRLSNLSLKFENETILEGYNQFLFKDGIARATIDSSNQVFLDKITEYMIEEENADKMVKIIVS